MYGEVHTALTKLWRLEKDLRKVEQDLVAAKRESDRAKEGLL